MRLFGLLGGFTRFDRDWVKPVLSGTMSDMGEERRSFAEAGIKVV